jgi:hypothetical protein
LRTWVDAVYYGREHGGSTAHTLGVLALEPVRRAADAAITTVLHDPRRPDLTVVRDIDARSPAFFRAELRTVLNALTLHALVELSADGVAVAAVVVLR